MSLSFMIIFPNSDSFTCVILLRLQMVLKACIQACTHGMLCTEHTFGGHARGKEVVQDVFANGLVTVAQIHIR
jgi:hypothetical protein